MSYVKETTSVTIGGREHFGVGLTPSHRVDVGRRGIAPVIIGVLPTIKVNQNAISKNINHSRYTRQRGVLLVNSLQLHADPESMRSDRLKEEMNERGKRDALTATCVLANRFFGAAWDLLDFRYVDQLKLSEVKPGR